MANLCTATIPFNAIERIQIYINNGRRQTVADIKTATGADYVLNGTLYNMSTGEAVCHLKADGKLYCSPAYAVYGYAWNTPGDFGLTLLPNVPLSGDIGKRNYIACDRLIPTMSPYIGKDRQGKRGRTAIGIKDGCLALYCSKDGTTAARTPEKLRDELYAAGWDDAIMLDGGGSSQCDFLGAKVKSSRKVAHLILVYLKKSACPYKEPTTTVKLGSVGEGAKWVQWMLNKWRPGLVVDGIFGSGSTSALKAFQKATFADPKEWDGKCGPKTRKELKKG
jgi:hypothetical protein